MFSHNEDKLQRGLIITDDISYSPILGIKYYKNIIIETIKKSYPKFSIGIYGDWGTGKTTLMNLVFDELKEENNNSIIPVWFNAWRYERENQFALFPLLQTIANSIPENEGEKKKNVKKTINKFGRAFIKGLIKSIPEFASLVFPSSITEPLKTIRDNTDQEIQKAEGEDISLLDKISQMIMDETLYSTHIENIEKSIADVREEDKSFKIVVFIDDLDRCSPNKTLEVLESIKVFLDLRGFIFVLGLSHNKISELITAYYKDKEIGIDGYQYLKKIIQIPINLPLWNANDIEKLIDDFVKKGILDDENHKEIINDNIGLIITAIENNPRDIKRFLNSFIIAFGIFSKVNEENSKVNDKFEPKILLILQAIQLRWNIFYDLLMNSDDEKRIQIFEEIIKIKNQNTEEIIFQIINSKKIVGNLNYDIQIINLLQDVKVDIKLWNFLSIYVDSLKTIKDWNIYRRAIEVTNESMSLKDSISIDSKPLLGEQEGKVITIPNYVTNVDDLLIIIFQSFPRNRIAKFTYGKEWVLFDPISQRVFKDIKSRSAYIREKNVSISGSPMITPDLKGHQSQTLSDAGIMPGMKLYVIKPGLEKKQSRDM